MAIITSTAFAGFNAPLPEFKTPKQLAQWRAEMAIKSQASTKSTNEETTFYTGKPYLASTGSYAFKYRSYNPELARWTSEDPSGFPDGANSMAFVVNQPNIFIDNNGLSGKSVLWATFSDLYGHGQDDGAGTNYIDAFTNMYNSTKIEMQNWDRDHTRAEGLYIRDGDIFDKHIYSIWSDFFAGASGYTEVYVSAHGSYNVTDGYQVFNNPSGTNGVSTSAFEAISGVKFVMATCANGYAPGTNVRGLDGSLGVSYDSTQLPDMQSSTKTTLWE